MPTLFAGDQDDQGEEDFADEELRAAGDNEQVCAARREWGSRGQGQKVNGYPVQTEDQSKWVGLRREGRG